MKPFNDEGSESPQYQPASQITRQNPANRGLTGTDLLNGFQGITSIEDLPDNIVHVNSKRESPCPQEEVRMWPNKWLACALVALSLTGCSGSIPAIPLLDGLLGRSSSLPEPKVSKEQAIVKATDLLQIVPTATEYTLDLAMLTTPRDVASGKVPGKTAISGVGFAAMGMEPDVRFWLVRFKKGEPEQGPPYALLNYMVDAETGEAKPVMSEGQALPGQEPFNY